MAYFMGSFSVSPASAGMIRSSSGFHHGRYGEPRIRGDDPMTDSARVSFIG